MLHIYQRVPSKISTIMVCFDAGGRAEGTKFSPGLAHMLEHMIFKGTEKRSYLDIPREIGFLGGSFNAYTSQEMVCFHISVPFENVDSAMEILSDIVFESTFPEEEFLKEREVVKEEELSSQDSVDSFIWDEFCKEFFEDRIAEPIIGTQESISDFTVKEIKAFHKKFYKKSNAIISYCGSRSKREAKGLLNKHFGRSSGKVAHNVPIFTPTYKEERLKVITRPKLEHAYVWVCYPGRPIGSPNEAAEDMLFSILGQGMDSRLFTEVREKRGLCYSVGSSAIGFRDYAATMIHSSTREENVEEMLKLIDIEVEKIKTTLVSDEELERARNKYRAQSYSITERSSALARTNLSRAFYGLGSLGDLEEEANGVTAEDIQLAAKDLFDKDKRLILICKEEEKDA